MSEATPRYSGTITLGNLLTAAVLAVSVGVAYQELRSEIRHERENRVALERRVQEWRLEQAAQTRADVADLKRELRELSTRIDRLLAPRVPDGYGGAR